MGNKVKDILKVKGNHVFSVESSRMVFEAMQQMCDRNIGGLLVVDDGQLLGIFTERDYARKLILKGKSSRETPIREIMTSNLITVTPETSIDECMKLMSNKRIRHLPVLEDQQLVGMVSIGDLVKKIIEDQQSTIEHLEQYIGGS